MKDRLEEFIHENREQFDYAFPSLKVWAKIDNELHPKKKSKKMFSLLYITKMVAVTTALVAMGTVIGLYLTNHSGKQQMAASLSLEDISPKHAELEQQYQQQIARKVNQLSSYSIDLEVKEDILQLEQLFNDLKKELVNVPPDKQELVIDAMIKNYQTRIGILERVLFHLEAAKQKEQRHDPKESDQIEL